MPVPSRAQLGGILPTLRSLDSYSARNVAAALDQGVEAKQTDDVWQQVCVRVLPLFNGEGIRGFVEELNESHVQRTFTRFQSSNRSRSANPSLDMASFVTGLLTAELTDLIRLGCATLSAKLFPPPPALPFSDQRLLSRLNEVWLFFFTGILPHLEGVFWVLRCDHRLRAAVGDTLQDRERQGRTGRAEGRVDVRRIALIEFRDQIIHPEFERLEGLFVNLYRPATAHSTRQPSPVPTCDPSPTPPDFRRSRSQPQRRASLSLNTQNLAPHPQPHRQHSSPSRLSPDPSYVPAFPSAASTPASPRFYGTPTPTSPSMPPSAAPSTAPSPTPTPLPAATAQALARRRQMVAVLSSLLTADDRQAEMDALLRLMRPVPASDAHRRGRRGTHEQSLSASPQPLDEAGEAFPLGQGGASGATTLTSSPVLMDEPSELFPPPAGDSTALPPPVPPLVTQHINARQRGRTMDSLDEEDGVDGFVTVSRPPPFSRHSTDGTTPIGSLFAAGADEADNGKKKSKRRSFLPRIGRSNSSNSTATVGTTGGESTEDDERPPSAGPGSGLAVPASLAMGGTGAGGLTSGDKLRRGLLRRNSSRKAAEMVASMGALGAASGFAIEDDAIE
ncbi:hypothetical protein JCM10207_006486 [Rhodosporidiobolus poonsookiae]